MDSNPLVLSTRPPSSTDKLLRNKFDEEIAAQVARMDDLAKLLLTIELAVPGLYATALKLVQGDRAVAPGLELAIAFFCWFAALALSLWALFPRAYLVDRSTVYIDENASPDSALSIEGFFRTSAKFKYHRILAACACFFVGLMAATVSIF